MKSTFSKLGIALGAFAIAAGVSFTAQAGISSDGVIEEIAKGCEKELTEYCSNVTVGQGRVLACIYAHGDKLSGRCEYAMYDAAAKLERAVNALSYIANECLDDAEKHCAKVELGEGRVINCLKGKKTELGNRCAQALRDTGMM